jgi:DNA transformation protein
LDLACPNFMPTSNEEKEFVSYIVDLMQSIGPIKSRPMFGGFGLFLDKLMFALVAEGVLYLKVDQQTRPDFEVRNLEAFSYIKNSKTCFMSYCQAPEEALENSDYMVLWANKAYVSALRASNSRK